MKQRLLNLFSHQACNMLTVELVPSQLSPSTKSVFIQKRKKKKHSAFIVRKKNAQSKVFALKGHFNKHINDVLFSTYMTAFVTVYICVGQQESVIVNGGQRSMLGLLFLTWSFTE